MGHHLLCSLYSLTGPVDLGMRFFVLTLILLYLTSDVVTTVIEYKIATFAITHKDDDKKYPKTYFTITIRNKLLTVIKYIYKGKF